MQGFTIIANTIFDSTLWLRPPDERCVFIWLMGHALPSRRRSGMGEVTTPPPVIAARNGIALDRLLEILDDLNKPDPYSRTTEYDGRRILIEYEPEFTIFIVNFGKYRAKDYTNAWRQERYRSRKAAERAECPVTDRYEPLHVTGHNGAVTYEHEHENENEHEGHNLEVSSATKCAAPANASAAPAMPPADEKPILTFPTRGKEREWHLTASTLAELTALYDGVDVLAEAKKALAWVTASRDRRKTAKGMQRFLVNWLNRAVDRSRRPAAAAAGGHHPMLPPLSADVEEEL